MEEKIIIIDFGSPSTQVIARKIRELNVYCEVVPYVRTFDIQESTRGIILVGASGIAVDQASLGLKLENIITKLPILAIGSAILNILNVYEQEDVSPAFAKAKKGLLQVRHDVALQWNMTQILSGLPTHYERYEDLESNLQVLHSETEQVTLLKEIPSSHISEELQDVLSNFVFNHAKCKGEWTARRFVENAIEGIREKVGRSKVIMAISGGVDSSVAATIIHNAIGEQLSCVFVDNGVLRKDEYQDVLELYKEIGLNVRGIPAAGRFYERLKGETDPEKKRKAIGGLFIEIFEEEAKKVADIEWLAQGTIYPDIIESISSVDGKVSVKSHHNVGGLPDKMHLKLLEPLKLLFKDEVRKIGKELGLPEFILGRHPFPGPGLAIRILGEVNADRVKILQEADDIFVKILREEDLYDKIWQAGAILLPIKSVGVTEGKRTYENTVALRAVNSVDGMSAHWIHLPYDLLSRISTEIINKVDGINRVVYDISNKPPATIEWE